MRRRARCRLNSNGPAASRSCTDAGVAKISTSSPLVSTAMCRLRPLTFLALSQPRLERGTVGATTRGYDAGKKINGRKRHIAVDTLGLLLTVMVTAASVKDNDAGRDLLEQLRAEHRHIALVWADGGYTGWLVTFATTVLALALTVVKRSDDAKGFVVLPRRWVVERSFSW